MLEISFKTADTKLYIIDKLFRTHSQTVSSWFSYFLPLSSCFWEALAGCLPPPTAKRVGISWLGSGYFLFFYSHSLCAQAHGWFLLVSALWTSSSLSSLPVGQRVPLAHSHGDVCPAESPLLCLSSALHSECLTSSLIVPSNLFPLTVFPYSIVRKANVVWPFSSL